ncbi:hypothetical protein L1987_18490 [Smallanthus sonchifolius]|uniref:Uncharacterized protein n=1 Tax=Smallanthus sonchifolius TaxID=185202 RepID=A0ACB9IZW7_9ASTR|nr:hypothetical protein L1987_18490 [Smallanthus sonchifolius]
MDLGSGGNLPQHHSPQHHSPPPSVPEHALSVDYSQHTYVLSKDTSTRVGHFETVVQRIDMVVNYLRGRVQQRLGDDDSEQEEEDDEDDDEDTDSD